MVVTLQEITRQVAINTGGYIESYATTVGDAATDINDTSLANHAASPNVFRSKWVEFLSAQNAGEIRRVTASTTIQLTIVAASVATPVGTRYAIYDRNPADITTAINMAIAESYGELYEHVVDESIVLDDLGRNSSFEESRTSLLFDADDDNVSIAAATVINDVFAAGATVTGWIHPFSDGEGDNAIIIDKRAGTTDGFRIRVGNEVDGFVRLNFIRDFSTTLGQWDTVRGLFPINKTSFFAWTYTDDDVDNNPTLYYATEDDGYILHVATLQESSTPVGSASTDASNPLLLGNSSAGTFTWDGLLSHIQIWNKERSMDKVAEYMHKRVDGINSNLEPDLLGWWVTDRNTGGTAIDASGNGNDGTITGAVFVEDFEGWTFGGTDPSASVRAVNLNEMVHGKASAKLTAAAGGAAQYRQFIDTQQAVGGVLHHRRWVRADGASRARIGIGGTNVTATFSDFHTGDSQWALLSMSYTMEDNDEDLYLICEAATSLTGLFGFGWSYIDRLYSYPIPTRMNRPAFVSMQADQERPDGRFVPLNDVNPTTGRILRIEGRRPLRELSVSTDTLPLDARYVPLLVEKASQKLEHILASRVSGTTREDHEAKADRHSIAYAAMVNDATKRMPRLGAEVGKNWHMEGGMLVVEGSNIFPEMGGRSAGVLHSANAVSPGTS